MSHLHNDSRPTIPLNLLYASPYVGTCTAPYVGTVPYICTYTPTIDKHFDKYKQILHIVLFTNRLYMGAHTKIDYFSEWFYVARLFGASENQ